ncbi:MAG TPA: hypothetical protein DCP92_12435 [Nitrospiraceae bacterium]|nr:hypothetical protein [Nitrospiraceae bacterium]
MGSHGKRTLERLFMGSVTRRVVGPPMRQSRS